MLLDARLSVFFVDRGSLFQMSHVLGRKPVDLVLADDVLYLLERSVRCDRVLGKADELLVNHAQGLALGVTFKHPLRQLLDYLILRSNHLIGLINVETRSFHGFCFFLDGLVMLVRTRKPVLGFLYHLLHDLHLLAFHLLILNDLSDLQIDLVEYLSDLVVLAQVVFEIV